MDIRTQKSVEDWDADVGNVFLSSTELGRIDEHWWTDAETAKLMDGFYAARTIWKLVKGYDPTQEAE